VRRAVFDWDDGNLIHIDGHRVSHEEAEEAFLDPDRLRADAYNARRERRRAFIGATEAERVLYVVYTMRDGRIRVVTAYDATDTERRKYWRSR
jgi:uncharacterized DUF497 family protein